MLGRVCPAPCEEHCRRDEVEEAIAIRDSHRYAGDQVLKAQAAGMKAPVPFEVQPPSGKRVAVIGSGPAGMAAAYYLAIAGHDVTVFERDPAPGGMLRYGIPQYRLPKVEVLEAEYQSTWDLGVQAGHATPSWVATSPSATSRTRASTRCTVAIGCYDTNKLGIPGEDADGVLDGLEYLRIATLGLPYPGHEGKRVVVVGGGFTSMDCSRTSVRQGAKEVTLVYRRDMKDMPAANEVHEMIEEGARAIFQAAPTRVVTDAQGKVTGIEFQRMAPGRARCLRPSPARAGGGHRVRHRVRPGAAGHRPGTRAGLDGARRGRRHARPSSGASRPMRSRSRRAGRVSSARAMCATGAATVVQAVAEGRRAAYAVDAYLKGMDLDAIRTRQTLAEPQPEFLSIVPYTGEVKEPRLRLKAMPAEVRNKSYVEYEIPYTQAEAMAESGRCLQCTCEAIGYCDLRRQGIEYGTTLGRSSPRATAPASGACPRTASRAPTTTTSATTATPSSCASHPAASTAAAAPTCARRSWARPATTSCAPASTRSSRRRWT